MENYRTALAESTGRQGINPRTAFFWMLDSGAKWRYMPKFSQVDRLGSKSK